MFNMTWLLEFSMKAAVLLSAARVAAFLLRRSPADVRHRLWLAAFFGVAILALPVKFPQPVAIGIPAQFSITTLSGALPARVGTGAWPLWSAIWIAGMIAALARLLAGVAAVAFWTRRARRINGVLISDLAATPLTWGVLRPVILFPACAAEWTAEQLEVALRHEQAHIARRDWLWQMLANSMNAVFWFHPLVWLANAELRREAESATDDMVLASGVDAADYAEQLVRVARFISGALPHAAVPMARGKILEARVREILDPLRRRGQASSATRAAVAVLACTCLVPLLAVQEESAFRAVRIAATTPAPPVPPQASEAVAPAQTARSEIVPPQTVPPQPAVTPPSFAAKPAPVPASSPGVVNPRPIYEVEPQYTEDARIAKIQGSVRLSLVIDEQGRADDIKVAMSLDPGLDERAVEAVRQWQFAPATKDGTPVPVTAMIEVNFRLL
jgi:TonB family protein